jgi:O-antigen ligase
LLKNLLFVEAITFVALGCFYFALTGKARAQLGPGPALVALSMPAAGFLLPSVWLVYIVCIAAIPLCARRRREIAPLYVFSLFVLPDLGLAEAFGLLKLSSLSTSTCFGIGALIAALWRGGLKWELSKLDVPFGLVLTILIVMTARSTSATNVLREIVDHALYYGLPYFMFSRLVKTPADFRRLMLALACAGCLLAAFLFAELVLHWPFYRPMYENLVAQGRVEIAVKFRDGSLRATGPFIEATSAAFCLTFAVFAASQCRWAFSSKLFHLAVMGGLLLGLLPPQSRGALLGVAVGLGMIYLYRRSQTVIASLMVGAGVLAAFFATVGLEPQSQVGASSHGAETIEYRKQLMKRGLEEFNKTPLTGDSFQNVLYRLHDLRQGEGIVDFVNTYLWIALLSGLAGLIPFIIAFLTRVINLWRLRARLRLAGFSSAPAAFVFASIVAPLTMLAFTSFGTRPAILIFIMLGLSTALLTAARAGKRQGAVLLLVPPTKTAAAQPSAFRPAK